MSEYAKQFVVRIVLGVPSTFITLALVGAIHDAGFYPEHHITGWIMTAPSIFATQAVGSGLLALLALAVWGALDFLVYRRSLPKLVATRTMLWLGLIAGIVIATACGGALLYSGNTNLFQRKAQSSAPILWEEGFLLQARAQEWGIEFYGFQITGTNNTDRFIGKLGGFVRSEKNGRKFPILLQEKNIFVAADGYGIPARHQFHVGAEFIESGGLPATKFLDEFGILTFVFQYEDQTFTKTYTFEEVSAEIAKAEEFLKPKPVKSQAGFKKIHDTNNSRPAEDIVPRRSDAAESRPSTEVTLVNPIFGYEFRWIPESDNLQIITDLTFIPVGAIKPSTRIPIFYVKNLSKEFARNLRVTWLANEIERLKGPIKSPHLLKYGAHISATDGGGLLHLFKGEGDSRRGMTHFYLLSQVHFIDFIDPADRHEVCPGSVYAALEILLLEQMAGAETDKAATVSMSCQIEGDGFSPVLFNVMVKALSYRPQAIINGVLQNDGDDARAGLSFEIRKI